MSNLRHHWHTYILFASALMAVSLFLYLLQPGLMTDQSPITPTPTPIQENIENAYYDESCNVIIALSSHRTVTIQTDHKKSEPTLKCYQVKPITISSDKKYVVFEGSDWHTKDQTGYNPGNYLGVYFAAKKSMAQMSVGSAHIQRIDISPAGILSSEIVYEKESPVKFEQISLPVIENHFEDTVNPQSKEIILLDGVIIK